MNLSLLDGAIGFPYTHPLDSDLSFRYCYSKFKQKKTTKILASSMNMISQFATPAKLFTVVMDFIY